jgi:hypothetical protein
VRLPQQTGRERDRCVCSRRAPRPVEIAAFRTHARNVLSADTRASITRLGGVEAVVGALRRHETSAAVSETACGALENLAVYGASAGVWHVFRGVEHTRYVRTVSGHHRVDRAP